jgi:tetratricopeptide (TPR) repeat protein
MEDAGQRLLLHYLDGDEVEQTKQDFKDAATYYKLAQVLTPESPFLSARLAFNSGRARLFDIVSAYQPADREKVFDSATDLLLQAYRAEPSAYVINALGIAYMEQAQWDRAVPAFKDAIRRAPSWPYPKHNLALSLMRSGKARDAIGVYQDAIQRGPDRSYLPFQSGANLPTTRSVE